MNNQIECSENFNWEATSEIQETNWDKTEFEAKYTKFKNILNNLNPNDKKERDFLIIDFYSKLEEDTWNIILEDAFKTKLSKNLNDYCYRNVKLMDFEIVNDKSKSLYEERFKTANIEKHNAWKIAEDTSFSNLKPEITEFMGIQFYQIRAKLQKEKLSFPFVKIMDILKNIELKYNGFIEFVFNQVLLRKNLETKTLKEIKKDGIQLMQSHDEILIQVLRYRNHKTFGFGFVWDTVITSTIETKDIGFFTINKMGNIIGNVWIDPEFRGNGIARKMFDFIVKTQLPKCKYLFMQTKNPIMAHLIKSYDTWNRDDGGIQVAEIGKTKCYESNKFSFTEKEKSLLAYNETLFVIMTEETNAMYDTIIRDWMNEELLFTNDFFPSISNKLGRNQSTDLYTLLNWNKEDIPNLKVLNITGDIQILPKYYNSNENTEIQYDGRVIQIDNDYYFLPFIEGNLYLPYCEDLRTALRKLDTKVEVYETETEFVVITNRSTNPEIFNYAKDKDQFQGLTYKMLKKLFEKRNLGSENIFDPKELKVSSSEIDYKNLVVKLTIDSLVIRKNIIQDYLLEEIAES